MKRLVTIGICFLAAVGVVFLTPLLMKDHTQYEDVTFQNEEAYIEQSVIRIDSSPHTIYRLYDSGQLIGVMQSRRLLEAFLEDVYEARYEEDFPNSSASLGKDVYLTEEESYYVYEDKDQEILRYLSNNGMFTLSATAVEFADNNGVYDEIYVANEEIYEEAMQEYLSLFVDSDDLIRLQNGETTSELTSYGSRAVGISIMQTITTRDLNASPEEIMTTTEEILQYLKYGDNTELEYYTVQQYDTVAGVGSKNYGLSATQVMNLNRDKISSVDQVLTEGMELCVTYFSSPIDITVTMESMRKEEIYPDTVYVEDSTLLEGETELQQEGVSGSRNTLYSEKWINGVLVSGSKISSVDTLQATNEIIAVGTLEVPGVGTGTFRWPVDNVRISCMWGCYYNHQAIDIVNNYESYGNIYAADRGVIADVGYNSISGNYLVINHNNGYETYYGHMYSLCPLAVGTVVDKGDVVGTIGMTGQATGPHVHFFIIENGTRRDPCDGFLDCTVTAG